MKIKEYNSGIYVIEVKGSEKFYIGSSINFKKRKSAHLRLLKRNKHTNKHLQGLCNKYGIDNLKFKLFIYTDPNQEYLLKLEQRVIDSYAWDDLINYAKFTGLPPSCNKDKRKFTENDIRNIFDLVADGETINSICEIYKIKKWNKHSIHQIIARKAYLDVIINNSIILLAQKNVTSNKNIKFSDEEIQIVKDHYKILGKHKLAVQLNRNPNGIANLARKLGLIDTSFWTKSIDDFLIKNYQLIGQLECAKKLGVSANRLAGRINTLKKKGVNIKINRNKWLQEEINFLMENYKELGSKGCSEKLNISRDSVTSKYNYEKNKINNGVLNG